MFDQFKYQNVKMFVFLFKKVASSHSKIKVTAVCLLNKLAALS